MTATLTAISIVIFAVVATAAIIYLIQRHDDRKCHRGDEQHFML